MDLQQVKKFIKDGYERNGFDVIEESPNGETLLRYPHPATYDVMLRISEDDVRDYKALLKAQGEFVEVGKTGISNETFRESLLIPLDHAIDIRDIDDLYFKQDADSNTYVEIDTASLVFANYFRFEPRYIQLCLDRFYAIPPRIRKESTNSPLDIRKLFASPLTVRVYDIKADTVAEAIQQSDTLIEGALFTLAYDMNIPLMLAEDFPNSRFGYREHLRELNNRTRTMTLPDDNFRHDLVRYYQAGLASPIAMQQFLSYYQILELFFQEIEHNGVHDELYQLLRDESFKPDNTNIAKIVTLIESNRREVSTEEMLEQLLRQHVDSEAIKQFIIGQSGQAEETVYTLAQRVVRTRDAIMATGTNTLPPSDKSVAMEVPLVKFLAEQVILSTRY